MKQMKKRIDRDLFACLFPSFWGTHILDDIFSFFVNAYIAVELGKFTDAIFSHDYHAIKENILVIGACLAIQIVVEPLLFAFFSAKSVQACTAFARKLLMHYLNKPYTQVYQNQAGDIPSRIDNDIMSFSRERLKQAGNRIMLPVFVLYLMYIFRGYHGWYVLITFGITTTAYVMPIVIRKITARYDADERAFRSVNGVLETELATNSYCLQSMKLDGQLIDKTQALFDSFYRNTFLKKNRCAFITGTINGICSLFSKIGIIMVGTVFLYKQAIQYGEIVTMLSLTGSMAVLLEKGTELITVKPILRNLYDRLQFFYEKFPTEQEGDADNGYSGEKSPVNGENIVEGHHVSMQYGDNPIFRDLSFFIPKGKVTLLKGANGSGKSTLIRLICGFESPASGEILYNGAMVKNDDTVSISLVAQDSSLFRYVGPKENILPDTDDGAVMESINRHFHAFLLDAVEEKQTTENLSGGEAQKVKIIRSLMKQSELLILDEPENHLDSDSIEYLIDCIKRENRSVLIVSHFEKLDRIVDHSIDL